jgi:hypothetical protein
MQFRIIHHLDDSVKQGSVKLWRCEELLTNTTGRFEGTEQANTFVWLFGLQNVISANLTKSISDLRQSNPETLGYVIKLS